MTDQPQSGRDETQHGYQPPYGTPRRKDSSAGPEGQNPEQGYGQWQDQPYGQATPEFGGSSAYSPPYGQAGDQYGSPYGSYGQPGGASYGSYGQPGGASHGAYGQPGGSYSPYGQPGGVSYNPYGQPGYYGPPAEPKGLSIASLCCGIAALMGFGFLLLPQIAAVILGHLALRREPSGRGMAIAGLVLGYVGVALTILVIVIFVMLLSSAQYSGYAV